MWTTLLAVSSPGGGDLPASGSHLEPHGIQLDAVLHEDGALVVRGHEPDGVEGELSLGDRAGTLVDLRGREVGRLDGPAALRPHQIVTVRVDPR